MAADRSNPSQVDGNGYESGARQERHFRGLFVGRLALESRFTLVAEGNGLAKNLAQQNRLLACIFVQQYRA